jgi:biotin carboxylase
MPREGILIVGGGLLQIPAIQKAKDLGYRAFVSDGNSECPSVNFADEFFQVSTKDIEGHMELAKRLVGEGRISAVYTQGCDVEYTVAMAAKAAGLPGIDPQVALNCNDKSVMRKLVNESGIDVVKFRSVSNLQDCILASSEVGFPCVIKPLDNSASRGVSVVQTEAGVQEAFEIAMECCFLRKEVIIEEFLEGDEYSIDTVFFRGKMYPAGISDREFVPKDSFSVQTGSLTPSRLPEEMQDEMYNLMEDAARVLGVKDGAFKGDLVLVGDEPKIIEVTARTSGGFDSQYRKPYSFGIDIIKATMDISLGKELDPADLIPRWSKWSKTTSVFPEPGIVTGISGLEELEEMRGVRKLFCLVSPGDLIEPYTDCSKRTNFAVISADTYDELLEIEKIVWKKLKIETVEK